MGQELCEIHRDWLRRKEKQEEDDVIIATGGVPAEVETPVALAPQDLPAATIDIQITSSILHDIESRSVFHDMQFPSETFVNVPAGTISSPL